MPDQVIETCLRHTKNAVIFLYMYKKQDVCYSFQYEFTFFFIGDSNRSSVVSGCDGNYPEDEMYVEKSQEVKVSFYLFYVTVLTSDCYSTS